MANGTRLISELPSAVAVALDRTRAELSVPTDDIAVSVRYLESGESAEVRGNALTYPASVVKLFHLVFLLHQESVGEIDWTTELERAVTDMIVDSSNDATALVVDTYSDTTGGPELAPADLEVWMTKRADIDRWFAAQGFPGIIVRQKTWNEAPYGRERQGYGPDWALRNSLSPNACRDLLTRIWEDRIGTPAACERVRTHLHRPEIGPSATNPQARDFIGRALTPPTRLYSKAGYVSTHRHDVAVLDFCEGPTLALAVFTAGAARGPLTIPTFTARLLAELGLPHQEDVSGVSAID